MKWMFRLTTGLSESNPARILKELHYSQKDLEIG
jgi:hypothetical protein